MKTNEDQWKPMKTGENQGKKKRIEWLQKFNYNVAFEKKTYDAKKTKTLTEMLFFDLCFNRRFYILQNQMQVLKKRKVMQLVKPIRYWQIAANTRSN